MLHGVSTKQAVDQLKAEGLKTLYRGILPPLCQKTVSVSIMFGMFDQYSRMFRQHLPSMSTGKLQINIYVTTLVILLYNLFLLLLMTY